MIWENILLALTSLRSNKMRALLTMLGIIIGIMSIIGIMTIGDAMTTSVSGELSSFGTNNITLNVQERGSETNMFAGMGRGGGGDNGGKQPETDDLVTDQIIAEIKEEFASEIDGVSISFSSGAGKAQEGELYANIAITGVNADYGTANNIDRKSTRLNSSH